MVGGDAGDINDPAGAALHHAEGDGVTEIKDAAQVGLHNLVPGFGLHADEEIILDHSRVVDEDIDRPQLLLDALHARLHGRGVGDIGLEGDSRAALGLDLIDEFAGGFLTAAIDNGHFCALGGERLSNGPADAAASARDQGYLILQPHECLVLSDSSFLRESMNPYRCCSNPYSSRKCWISRSSAVRIAGSRSPKL